LKKTALSLAVFLAMSLPLFAQSHTFTTGGAPAGISPGLGNMVAFNILTLDAQAIPSGSYLSTDTYKGYLDVAPLNLFENCPRTFQSYSGVNPRIWSFEFTCADGTLISWKETFAIVGYRIRNYRRVPIYAATGGSGSF